jgi:hypothetical protein
VAWVVRSEEKLTYCGVELRQRLSVGKLVPVRAVHEPADQIIASAIPLVCASVVAAVVLEGRVQNVAAATVLQ